MTMAAPSKSLAHRTLKESSERALRVFRFGMWILLAFLLIFMAKNYRVLRDEMDLMRMMRGTVATNCGVVVAHEGLSAQP